MLMQKGLMDSSAALLQGDSRLPRTLRCGSIAVRLTETRRTAAEKTFWTGRRPPFGLAESRREERRQDSNDGDDDEPFGQRAGKSLSYAEGGNRRPDLRPRAFASNWTHAMLLRSQGQAIHPIRYTTRATPPPFTTSPMRQALCFWEWMKFNTASAWSAATMATMPMPMLKT